MKKIMRFGLMVMIMVFLSSSSHARQEAWVYFDFGVFALEDGEYEDAEKNFKKALELNPDEAVFHHFLGKTYLEMERFDEAREHFEAARKISPELSGLKYDIAYLNYKTGDYPTAGRLFSEVANDEPLNVLAFYHAGICLFRQDNYENALPYFIAASEKSPTIQLNGYYYAGICYFKIGNIEQAKEKFIYVRDNASDSLRQNAIEWLETIETNEMKFKPYSLFLKIGGQYDDNVRFYPDNEVIGEEKEDDFCIEAYFSGSYDFISKGLFRAGAGYSHYQNWHFDITDYDTIGSIASLYGSYRYNAFTFRINYLPTYFWVDGDKYLMRHRLQPELTWNISNPLYIRFAYQFYDSNYFDEDDRDGNTNGFFTNVYYMFGADRGYFFGGIGYEDNAASNSDYDYGCVKTTFGVAFKLPGKLNLNIGAGYNYKKYDDTDSAYDQREDKKYSCGLSISRNMVYEWLGVLAEFDYIKNDSNIADYDYERNVVTLSVTAKY